MLPYINTYITISETDPQIVSLFTSCSSIQYLDKFIVNKHATTIFTSQYLRLILTQSHSLQDALISNTSTNLLLTNMLPYSNTYITISETDHHTVSLFTSCYSIQYLNKFIVNKHATIQQYLHYNI